jgi:ParB-like chromosome segregation protein Spo0J
LSWNGSDFSSSVKTKVSNRAPSAVGSGDPKHQGRYFLLDGHLRVEVLKDLGIAEVECLVATDDETYTYNKRINRLPPIQEHRMIQRAIDRGVPKERIAEALGLDVQTVRRRTCMLEGICANAAEILKDTPCPAGTFDVLRRMAAMRQVEGRARTLVLHRGLTGPQMRCLDI